MAIVKICDFCSKKLGGETWFVQTQGSVSDQYEPGGTRVEFRYLTDKKDEVHTFCDDDCEMDWRARRRDIKDFSNRV